MFQEVDSISVTCDGVVRSIVLAKGDLARIDPAQGVDLLVISALRADYTPTPRSLVGQLTARGIPVQRLALFPDRDLRDTMGAWLSHPVEHAGFKRLVGFEPEWVGDAPQVVGQLFRALFPFLDESTDQIVAMPMLSTGDAGWAVSTMLPPLLESAVEWLKLGLPVKTLFIVSRSDAQLQEMERIFSEAALTVERDREESTSQDEADQTDKVSGARPEGTAPAGGGAVSRWMTMLARRFGLEGSLTTILGGDEPGGAGGETDAADEDIETTYIFLSFSSHDADIATRIRRTLEAAPVPIEVFDFRRDIPIGTSYQREIDAAMKQADRTICVLSPDYLASPECEEELMVARLRNKRLGFTYLWPVYWRGVEGDLEDWIMILNLADCREANEAQLLTALHQLKESIAA